MSRRMNEPKGQKAKGPEFTTWNIYISGITGGGVNRHPPKTMTPVFQASGRRMRRRGKYGSSPPAAWWWMEVLPALCQDGTRPPATRPPRAVAAKRKGTTGQRTAHS